MRRLRIYCWIITALLALSGCATQTVQQYGIAPRGTVTGRTNQIAVNYNAAMARGGLAAVIHEIQECYIDATGRLDNQVEVIALRDCMSYDYHAYNINQLDGPVLPFFTDDAMKMRLAHYGPMAQFDTAEHMIAYLKDTHQLVQKYMIRDLKQRNGSCMPNGPAKPLDPQCL